MDSSIWIINTKEYWANIVFLLEKFTDISVLAEVAFECRKTNLATRQNFYEPEQNVLPFLLLLEIRWSNACNWWQKFCGLCGSACGLSRDADKTCHISDNERIFRRRTVRGRLRSVCCRIRRFPVLLRSSYANSAINKITLFMSRGETKPWVSLAEDEEHDLA